LLASAPERTYLLFPETDAYIVFFGSMISPTVSSSSAPLCVASPVFLYWVTRVWMLSHRRLLHEDPVLFVLRDRVTYAVGVLCATIMSAATRAAWRNAFQ
jgi:hypothetical protein